MINIFKHLKNNFMIEIETIQKQYASEEFLFTDEPLILRFFFK